MYIRVSEGGTLGHFSESVSYKMDRERQRDQELVQRLRQELDTARRRFWTTRCDALTRVGPKHPSLVAAVALPKRRRRHSLRATRRGFVGLE